ncbi:MAG: hypothetical protein IJO08_02815 [Clostridia bacterium]|nr:hypothetical protein [Clostridia bacterium]
MTTGGCPETAKQVVAYALDVLDREEKYLGVVLCEGVWGGIDVTLYQEVYPQLLVIPCGGCEHVLKFIPTVRKRLYDYTVVGLIDRDSRPKKEIRELGKEGVYCTKLPFIENIISCPEVIRILAPKRGYDPDEVLEKIERNLLSMLCKKLRNSLPINIPFANEETETFSVKIQITSTTGECVEKFVDRGSVLYAYRDKSVANETSFMLGLHGRKKYYEFFSDSLNDPELRDDLLKCANKFLPEIFLDEPKEAE